MIARALRVLASTVTLLIAVIAGALVGRAISTEVLPDLDALSPVAESLVPANATDLRSYDLDGATLANVNIFLTPASPEAFRDWRVDDGADDELARVVAELEDRGWQRIEDEGQTVELVRGRRIAVVHADPPSRVYVSLRRRPGWLLYLPTVTAMLGAVVAAALWRGWRGWRRRRPRGPAGAGEQA